MLLLSILVLAVAYEKTIYGFFSRYVTFQHVLRFQNADTHDPEPYIKKTPLEKPPNKIQPDTPIYDNNWSEGEIPWEIEDDHEDENKTSVRKNPTPDLPKPTLLYQRVVYDFV